MLKAQRFARSRKEEKDFEENETMRIRRKDEEDEDDTNNEDKLRWTTSRETNVMSKIAPMEASK